MKSPVLFVSKELGEEKPYTLQSKLFYSWQLPEGYEQKRGKRASKGRQKIVIRRI